MYTEEPLLRWLKDFLRSALVVCNMNVTLCTVRGVRDQQSHNADPALCTQGKPVEYYVLTVRAENVAE